MSGQKPLDRRALRADKGVMIATICCVMAIAYLSLWRASRVPDGIDLAGSGRLGARWFAYLGAGTVAGSVLAMAVFTFVDPVLAVWAGGAVVLAGAGCIVARHESERRRLSRSLDRELAALLEAA